MQTDEFSLKTVGLQIDKGMCDWQGHGVAVKKECDKLIQIRHVGRLSQPAFQHPKNLKELPTQTEED